MNSKFQGKTGNEIFASLLEAEEVEDFFEAAQALADRKAVSATDLIEPVFRRFAELIEEESSAKLELLRGILLKIVGAPSTDHGHWPTTLVLPSENGLSDSIFDHEFSALKLCGYTVSKKENLSESERRDILVSFFERKLHPEIERIYDNAYDDPKSTTRLLKMANVIASNCRNFKRKKSASYSDAIDKWEQDLNFLKVSYFDPRTRGEPDIEWPSTEN